MIRAAEKRLMDDIELVLGERKALLSVEEFSQLTGLSVDYARRLCARGEIRATQVRHWGPWRVHFREVARFID